MRKLMMILALLTVLSVPAFATEYTAPSVPDTVQPLMPAETETFGQGLWHVIRSAVSAVLPEVSAAAGTCLAICAVVMLTSVLNSMPGKSKKVSGFICILAISTALIGQTNTLIGLGSDTVRELSEYGKLLLPVMTGALAAQGGMTGATALYAGTTVFNTVLTTLIGKLLVPMIYMFLVLAIACSATGEEMLKKIRDLVKWLMTWGLKTILYVFTGYMTITGVISGTADATALKAAKLTISGVVPVVGGILSDASEAVVLGAGVMKSAAGVYGVTALLALCITPFLKIGIQYLVLKLTAALCSAFDIKPASDVVSDFSSAMGLLLGMTGTVCIMLMISVICFMKGMG